MLTFTGIDTTGFNAGLRGLANVGIPMATVIKKESGELIKTLVKISPAANATRIRDDVKRKFEWQQLELNPKLDGQKASGSGLTWVNVNEHYLTGIDPQLDMRDASVDELKRLLYQITKGGRIRKEFTHPRTKQKVLILTKLLTKKKTVNALASAKAKNRGRLKASWATAVRDGFIQLTSGNAIPQWVRRHLNREARGYWRSDLQNKLQPSFTIASYAKGLSVRAENYFIKAALKVRAKAMAANAALYFKGKKRLADYASI